MFDGLVFRAATAIEIVETVRWTPGFKRTSLCAPLKRAFDLLVAASVLLVLAPAYGLIALLIALDSRGPILFRQKRTGLNGRIFVIYKFRTMRPVDGEAGVRHATKDDDRVTRLGRLLRTTSLDELPQLLNVIKGDMSLVGPRPHAVEHDELYGTLIPHYRDRFQVRPGLTGLAQVQGLRGGISELNCMVRRVDADVLYTQRWSFPADLALVVRTIPVLLGRANAY